MRLYWEVARRSYRTLAAYRGATVAGVFTNTVFGFLLAYVLLAVYRERDVVGGFDAVDAVTFTFLAQGLFMLVGVLGDGALAERIRTGDVVADLYRPLDQQAWWAATAFGRAGFYALYRGVPPVVVGALAFELRLPASLTTWAAFAVSVALAVAAAFGWAFLVQLSAFWLLDVRGVKQLGDLAAQFFAGTFVPLVFFPAALADVARALPFASMLQLPVEVVLGKHTGAGLARVWATQIVWVVVLAGAGRLVLARALRRVVVQGG